MVCGERTLLGIPREKYFYIEFRFIMNMKPWVYHPGLFVFDKNCCWTHSSVGRVPIIIGINVQVDGSFPSVSSAWILGPLGWPLDCRSRNQTGSNPVISTCIQLMIRIIRMDCVINTRMFHGGESRLVVGVVAGSIPGRVSQYK